MCDSTATALPVPTALPVQRPAQRFRHAIAVIVSVIAALLAVATPSGMTEAAAPPAPPNPAEQVDPIDPIEIPNIPTIDLPIADTAPESPRFTPRQADFDANGFGDDDGPTSIGIELPDVEGGSSNVVVIILLLSVLSVAPSVLVLTTSFTRIVIVLSLTRNALGIPQLPPQQVIVGLSLFLTLFVMGPTLELLNENALQPLLDDEITLSEAYTEAEGPIREFMLESTREAELKIFLDAADIDGPVVRDEVPLKALIPAFVLSELKSAFIIGFIIFVPFMVIDLVVSAVLTSLGMMMLPPTFVSLPMKLLLFILLDGWTLVVTTLLSSY